MALVEKYHGARFSCDVDYTNMDGSVGAIERELDRRIRLRLFDPEDHFLVDQWTTACCGNRVYARHGTIYDQGHSQASGFADTSTGNTCRNAFVSYIALRLMGHMRGTAWDALGLYGGDDGTTPNLPVASAERAAIMVGKQIKATRVNRGEPICFLARYYGEVWDGSPNSCSDIRRALLKIHLTTRKDVSDAVARCDKARSLMLTDANTPILGVIARNWIKHSNHAMEETEYAYGVSPEGQPMNVRAPWMEDIAALALEPNQRDVFHNAMVNPKTISVTVALADLAIKPDDRSFIGGIEVTPSSYVDRKGKGPAQVESPPEPGAPGVVTFGEFDDAMLPAGPSTFHIVTPAPTVAQKGRRSPEEYEKWKNSDAGKAWLSMTKEQQEAKKLADKRRKGSGPDK